MVRGVEGVGQAIGSPENLFREEGEAAQELESSISIQPVIWGTKQKPADTAAVSHAAW